MRISVWDVVAVWRTVPVGHWNLKIKVGMIKSLMYTPKTVPLVIVVSPSAQCKPLAKSDEERSKEE
jgi:hypothetical protein